MDRKNLYQIYVSTLIPREFQATFYKNITKIASKENFIFFAFLKNLFFFFVFCSEDILVPLLCVHLWKKETNTKSPL
jgi:hypothetical protein